MWRSVWSPRLSLPTCSPRTQLVMYKLSPESVVWQPAWWPNFGSVVLKNLYVPILRFFCFLFFSGAPACGRPAQKNTAGAILEVFVDNSCSLLGVAQSCLGGLFSDFIWGRTRQIAGKFREDVICTHIRLVGHLGARGGRVFIIFRIPPLPCFPAIEHAWGNTPHVPGREKGRGGPGTRRRTPLPRAAPKTQGGRAREPTPRYRGGKRPRHGPPPPPTNSRRHSHKRPWREALKFRQGRRKRRPPHGGSRHSGPQGGVTAGQPQTPGYRRPRGGVTSPHAAPLPRGRAGETLWRWGGNPRPQSGQQEYFKASPPGTGRP